MKTFKIGDKVCFTAACVKRVGHDAISANMRGIVVGIDKSFLRVDTNFTWCNEDGNSIRCIPTANLAKVGTLSCFE